MKKKLILAALFAVALLALPLVSLGQVPEPTPTPVITDGGLGVNLPSGVLKIALAVLAQGLLVSKMIDGLKNTPGLANFFETHPWAAAVSNALVSFFVAAPVCFAATGHLDLNCLAAAVMTFFASSGFHLARVQSNPKPVTDANGMPRSAPSPSVSDETLKKLDITPIAPPVG